MCVCVWVSTICWTIWKAQNKASFDGKKLKNPIEIMCHACALMRFLIGLYAELDREMLINGVNTMLKAVAEILIPNGSDEDMQKQLKHGGQHDDEDHIRICKR